MKYLFWMTVGLILVLAVVLVLLGLSRDFTAVWAAVWVLTTAAIAVVCLLQIKRRKRSKRSIPSL